MSDALERPRRRFTTDEVLQMVDAGILGEDERLELIDGELFMMSPQGPSHRFLTVRLHNLLMSAYGNGFHVQDHSPIQLAPNSLPEPDVAVIRGDVDAYAKRIPSADDVVLAIEIAVTTLRTDRAKASVYAKAGVRDYWIVDVEGRRLETYAEPTNGTYGRVSILSEEQSITPPGLTAIWQVRDLLP